MSSRRIIGLSGGIGSGKSTVAALLAERGATVIDADRLGHEVYEPGTEGFAAVVESFGEAIVGGDGRIDRRRLGERAFAAPEALARLNAIVHPLIGRAFAERVAAAPGDRPVVIEAAVMIEAGWHHSVEELWVVLTEPETAIGRVVASRDLDESAVRSRVAQQLSNAEREAVADVVIRNDGSLEDLKARVAALWAERLAA